MSDEANEQWNKNVVQSPVTDFFSGQISSTISCGNCNAKTTSYDSFFTLSLPLPEVADVILYLNVM